MVRLDNIQDNHLPTAQSSNLGRFGETAAARFLERRGCRLVLANFKAPVGRNRLGVSVTGEIDLIVLDGDVLCFTEVKTRSSAVFSAPLSAVDLRKQRQIIRTARVYRRIFGLDDIKYRYDVVSVVREKNRRPRIEHFQNFWTESKFRKKYRDDEF
jgi:putative endonuclease